MPAASELGVRRTPNSLVVLSDDSCPLCRTLKSWMSKRRPLVPITVVDVGSPEACKWFPQLDQAHAREHLTVIDDIGLVYEGDSAFVMCAWALPGLRSTAHHMTAHGALLRVGLNGVQVVRRISKALFSGPEPIVGAHSLDSDGSETTGTVVGETADASGGPGHCSAACPTGFPAGFSDEIIRRG